MGFATLVKICVLRANPQDLPTSDALTVLALAAYFGADIATALLTVSAIDALLAAAVDTLLLVLLARLALGLRRHENRLRQTLAAIAGAGALTAFATLLAYGLLPEGMSPAIVWVPSLLWSFAVGGHILHHALEVPFAAGIAATGVYLVLSVLATTPFLTVAQPS